MIARPVRNGEDIDNDTRQGQCHAAGAVGNDSAEHGPWVIGLCRPIRVTETTSRWIKHAPHNDIRQSSGHGRILIAHKLLRDFHLFMIRCAVLVT